MQALFSKTIDLLSGMLDYRSARHKVIVANIANLDTPGFKPQELTFASSLAQAQGGAPLTLTRTHSKHLPAGPAQKTNFQTRQAGDKVEIDREMTSLAENNLNYNMTVELLSRKFKGIGTALTEIK
jgi:flagellar basal-body rod protein FlgB